MAVDTRILFTDLDGTLLNDKKEITPGNRAAVDEALAKGHKIVVTTGRALASGLQIAERRTRRTDRRGLLCNRF